jgi:hypothetical protein
MKKGILFAGGVALTLAFAGCDDGSAKIAEIQAQLDAAKQERDALVLTQQEEVTNLTTTFQFQVDSLQYIIDSLTAPKGTVAVKPKLKPAPAPVKEEPKKVDPKGDKMGGGTGTTNTDIKNDKMGGGTGVDKAATDKKKNKMGNP